MRVAVIDTNKMESTLFYDVENIKFYPNNDVRLSFKGAQDRLFHSDEYTDIDIKKAVILNYHGYILPYSGYMMQWKVYLCLIY